jgi:hypothetical protein
VLASAGIPIFCAIFRSNLLFQRDNKRRCLAFPVGKRSDYPIENPVERMDAHLDVSERGIARATPSSATQQKNSN